MRTNSRNNLTEHATQRPTERSKCPKPEQETQSPPKTAPHPSEKHGSLLAKQISQIHFRSFLSMVKGTTHTLTVSDCPSMNFFIFLYWLAVAWLYHSGLIVMWERNKEVSYTCRVAKTREEKGKHNPPTSNNKQMTKKQRKRNESNMSKSSNSHNQLNFRNRNLHLRPVILREKISCKSAKNESKGCHNKIV